MWDNADDQRIAARQLLGSLSLSAAVLLVLSGFLLPTHDYAGLGDAVLASMVSDDARDFAAMLATMSLLLAGSAMVVIRSRGFVIVSAVILVLGLVNLVRLVPYY